MLNLSLIAGGLFAFTRLNVDQMPDVQIAYVTIDITLEGAGPELIEAQITRPVEDAVAVLDGVDELKSTSSVGRSHTQIKFQVGIDGDQALDQARQKVDALINQFPLNTETPVYGKYSSSEQPVVTLAVTGKRSLRELTEIAKRQVGDRLQTVDGVGDVKVNGGRERAILIQLDAAALEEHQISPAQVVAAVEAHSAQVPGGYIRNQDDEYLVTVDTNLVTAQDFANIIVNEPKTAVGQGAQSPDLGVDESPVRVGDVARVIDGEKDPTSLSRLNGKDTLTLDVTKTAEANLVNVVKDVKDELDYLRKLLPPDIKVELVRDNSVVIEEAVTDLQEDILLGTGLACLVVLIFLFNLRLTIVAGIAIPISLIASFMFMWLFGFTLNYMTLLALSLAVGIVVDDAVVVLENITKTIEETDLEPIDAAQKGLEEISFAVLATTCSLVVLFLPLAFMPGEVGAYFRSWGVVMAVTISLSMVVSFTLTPTLSARFLKKRSGPATGPGFLMRTLQNTYGAILGVALKLRWLVLIIVALSFIWGLHLLRSIGTEFLAKEDEGSYTVNLRIPSGWPLERAARELVPVEAELRKLPHVKNVLLTGDGSTPSFYIGLEDWDKRKPYDEFDSIDEARQVLARFALLQPSVDTGDDKDFEYVIAGDDLGELTKLANGMMDGMRKIDGFVDIASSMTDPGPQVDVQMNQQAAADLNVNVQQAAQSVQIFLSGLRVTSFQRGINTYDVIVRALPDQRQEPEDVKHIVVASQNPSTGLITLDTVADISVGLGPGPIEHLERQRRVTVSANLTPELPLGAANDKAEKLFKDLKPPPGYGPLPSGNTKFLQETAIAALQSFVLSVLFMYMVMASQFENLLDPLIVLCTLPLAIPFAIFSLVAAHMTLNLFSVLGLFLLFGVVKKNAILQIDRTNQLVRGGMESHTAIIEANKDRIRPILMTTLTLVVAMIPVAWAGPTGAMRAPMAMVVVGGQSLCLLLTLVVVPVGTSIVEDIQRLFRRKKP